MRLNKNNSLKNLRFFRFILLPILVWFFYNGLLIHNYGKLRTRPVATNYWSYLANAFLDGQTDIETCPPYSNCHDLIFHNEKKYLYWPPAPTLVYMPIVAALGASTPDLLIASIFGAINVWLFSLFLFSFSKRYKLNFTFWDNQIWTLFWAFGTVHFYMSMSGTVWYVAQIFAQTFLLSGFIILLKASKKNWGLLLSGTGIALACYTRNNLIFAYFLALGIYASDLNLKTIKNIPILLKKFSLFISPFIILSISNLYYNFIRFGNVFENGLDYHNMDAVYRVNFDKYGYFNFRYIPQNFYDEVLRPPIFSNSFPFFEVGADRYGFGLLWASPIFILFIVASFLFLKKWFENKSKMKITTVISQPKPTTLVTNYFSLIGISLVILSIMGSGWAQFASRYSLDYQLFLIIPILFFFKKWKRNKWISLGMTILFFISIYVNYFGARMFHYLE